MKKKLFVIDAMALAYRSYHALGGNIRNSKGLPTAAIMGTATFLERLIEKENPDYLLIASDMPGKTFRHDLYQAYKANRKPMPEDLSVQIPYLYQLFKAMDLPVLKETKLEADDLIGTLCAQSTDLNTYIVSGDKDFLQLVNSSTSLYSSGKAGVVKISGPDDVMSKFGVTPGQFIDVLAIMGDTADNIPGIPGIGEKGACKLISQFGTLENIYKNLDSLPNNKQKEKITHNKELAILSKILVTIKKDCHIPTNWREASKMHENKLLSDDLGNFYTEMEFRTLAKKWETRKTGEQTPDAPAKITGKESYRSVSTRKELEILARRLRQTDSFAFDTETSGLDIVQDTPIGMAFALKENEAYYVPLTDGDLIDVTPATILEELKEIFNDKNKIAIGHNIKFDIQMMLNIGIEIKNQVADTMVAAHLVNPNLNSYSLDSSCLFWLNYAKIPTASLIGKNAAASMLEVDFEKLVKYACEDADLTLRLYKFLFKQMEKLSLLQTFKNVESPLIAVLAKMERQGIYVDTDSISNLSLKIEIKLASLAAKIYELAEEEFNVNSPAQLRQILYEKMKIHDQLGVKNIKKTKSGLSTDVQALSKLSDHPLPCAILKYRSLSKLKNTYTDRLPELVNSKSNRIHTSFHQTGTQTGRLSSSTPNLQNIPIRTELGKEVRKAFTPANTDSVIIAADYSQIELRLLAHLANESSLKEDFRAGRDIHTATAAAIFSIPQNMVTREQRARAKAINFGLIYGMGPKRLASETGVSMAEAKDFVEKYFKAYPGIKNYIDRSIAEAKSKEFVTTLSGRRRPLKEINSSNRMMAVNAEHIAINTPIQGSAADLIKLAMIKIEKKLEESKLHAKMLLQVHDELVFECPKAEAQATRNLIEEEMEHAFPLEVPIKVEVGEGNNWLEAH